MSGRSAPSVQSQDAAGEDGFKLHDLRVSSQQAGSETMIQMDPRVSRSHSVLPAGPWEEAVLVWHASLFVAADASEAPEARADRVTASQPLTQGHFSTLRTPRRRTAFKKCGSKERATSGERSSSGSTCEGANPCLTLFNDGLDSAGDVHQ